MAPGDNEQKSRLVTVNLAGSNFTIRTDAGQDYVAKLERYVNQKLEAVQPEGRPLPLKSALALAALSMADDYFSADDSRAALDQNVRERLKRILVRLDAALEGEPRE
jgi:cell division protein ZapA (FtsZ GTPase activity inhibitor)